MQLFDSNFTRKSVPQDELERWLESKSRIRELRIASPAAQPLYHDDAIVIAIQ